MSVFGLKWFMLTCTLSSCDFMQILWNLIRAISSFSLKLLSNIYQF